MSKKSCPFLCVGYCQPFIRPLQKQKHAINAKDAIGAKDGNMSKKSCSFSLSTYTMKIQDKTFWTYSIFMD